MGTRPDVDLPNPQSRPKRADVLGFPVDALSPAGARDAIAQALSDPWDGCCRHVVTLNPEYVMAARRDAAFASAIRAADLFTVDGIGVALAVRLDRRGGESDFGRVTGVQIVHWLAAMSGPSDAPLFLLGGRSGIAEEAAAALGRQYPNAMLLAGTWSDRTPRPEDDADTNSRIAASGAKAVAVAYGAPAQVLWIERNRAALADAGVRLAIGVGGTLDFIAGRVPRAPAIIQRIGLEWLYRLLREPWRWRRQLVLSHFAALVLRHALTPRPPLPRRDEGEGEHALPRERRRSATSPPSPSKRKGGRGGPGG